MKSSKRYLRKPFYKKRFFWLGILFLVFAILIFYFLFISDYFRIKEIKISGNQKISSKEIRNLVLEKIEQKIFWQWSFKKNIFLISEKNFEKIILEKFFLITDIILIKKFPDKIEVVIKEREPVGIYCQFEDCFYIDKNGVLFEKAPQSSGSLLLMIESEIAKDVSFKEKALSQDKINFILLAKDNLRKIGVEVWKFSIVSPIDIKAKSSEGWDIYFDNSRDSKEQIFVLSQVLENRLTPEERKNLEYMDLRIKNRVYYR